MASNLWLVIGLSGVTCSGKTTLANSLHEYFTNPANAESAFASQNMTVGQVKMLNQDAYFLPIDHPKHTFVEALKHNNWEIITALDMDRMCKDILNILGAKFTLYSTKLLQNTMEYCDNLFLNHYAERGSSGEKVTLNVLILEGFLLFNHSLTVDVCGLKLHLHLPYERCYERRVRRTYDPADVPGYFEMIVWPHYEKHFKEFSTRSDIVFLNGEMSQEKLFNFTLNFLRNSL